LPVLPEGENVKFSIKRQVKCLQCERKLNGKAGGGFPFGKRGSPN